MARVVLFHKPWGVLPQFTDPEGRPTLADYIAIPGVYPAGRLDRDSEGLLVLTDDGRLNARLTQPQHKTSKTYWVQVEGEPDDAALHALRDRQVRRMTAAVGHPTLRLVRYRVDSWTLDGLARGEFRTLETG